MRRSLSSLAALLLAACSSGAVVEERRFSLLLEALSDAETTAVAETRSSLSVRPVVLPEYLRSRSMMLQVGDNEVIPARRHFWAEPLDESVRQVLVQDLGNRLDVTAVTWRRPAPGGCELTVTLQRFHATDRGRVAASGRYRLADADSAVEQAFDVSQPQTGDGYANAVAALRQAIGALASLIVSDVDVANRCRTVEPPSDASPDEEQASAR